MEPIRKVLATDSALARIPGLQPTERVERRDPEPDPEARRRRPKPRRPAPAAGEVRRDADGVPHIDVQA